MFKKIFRQTKRQIVRQKDRQSQGQIGRKKQMDQWKDKRNGETVADKKTDTWSQRQTVRHAYIYNYRQTTAKHTHKQKDRQKTEKQKKMNTDRHRD